MPLPEYRFPTQRPDHVSSDATYSPLLHELLRQRGLTDPVTIATFLKPQYETGLHPPELLHQCEVACARIEAALQANERIAVFADYDCDGIPGAVVLHDYLRAVGHENFRVYIPHRHYEGFGLSEAAVLELADDDVSLIITIDCGSTDHAAVQAAVDRDVDVIITDHHEPGETLPPAIAVVNPKLGDYPFPDLCGAAVIFKVVQALLARGTHQLPPGWEKWWLDMVGIATIADMVPLRGENRVLAHYGLHVLRKSRRPGVQHLLRTLRVPAAYLSEDDIGFTIGPRINAASRMDSPEAAFALLTATDVGVAGEQVRHLERLNTARKTAVAKMTKELHARLDAVEEVPAVLVCGSPGWRPSPVGLAASHCAGEYARPVFLWGRDGNEVCKGSCRSGGTLSVVTLMAAAQAVFSEYGGHHASGGFSIKPECIHEVSTALNAAAASLGARAEVREPVVVAAELCLTDLTDTFLRELAQLAPFGMGNEKPLFAFPRVVPQRVERFGKGEAHTKLRLSAGTHQVEAIAFFKQPEQFPHVPVATEPCTVLGHVERSYFRGRAETRIRLVDILPADAR